MLNHSQLIVVFHNISVLSSIFISNTRMHSSTARFGGHHWVSVLGVHLYRVGWLPTPSSPWTYPTSGHTHPKTLPQDGTWYQRCTAPRRDLGQGMRTPSPRRDLGPGMHTPMGRQTPVKHYLPATLAGGNNPKTWECDGTLMYIFLSV